MPHFLDAGGGQGQRFKSFTAHGVRRHRRGEGRERTQRGGNAQQRETRNATEKGQKGRSGRLLEGDVEHGRALAYDVPASSRGPQMGS